MEDNQVQSVGDPLKDLYTEFNPKLNLAKSFDEFKSTMQDPANRKSFFDEFNSKLNLAKDYDQFDETLGLKKKDGGTPSVSSVTPSPSTVQPTQEYKSNDYTLADGTQMSNVAPQKPIQQDNGGFDVNKSVDKINGLKQKLDTYNNIVAQSSFNDDDKRELRRLNGELGANIGSLATRGQNPLDQEGYNNSVKNYNETSNKINALLSKKGGMTDDQIADYKNTVDELNGEIGKINEFDKNSQVSKINPVTEERYQAVDKVRQMLAKSSPQGIHEANELNHYQTNENFDLIHSTQSQLDIIDKSELTPEQKEESRGLLRQSNSPLINSLDTELARKYNDPNNEFKGVLTPDEYAGLMTLKMFDPAKYDNAVGAITTKITPKYEHSSSFDLENLAINSDSKESDETISQKIGKESTLRNLGEIGRQNKSVFVAEKMHDLSNNYVNTDDATQKGNIQNQIAAYQSTNDAIAESKKGDDTRFPLTTQLNLDNQVKELTQEAGMNPAESILYKFGKGFGATVNSMQNVATGLFGSDEDNNRLKMQRAGESAIEQGEQYLPEEYKKMKSPVIPVFNKELITEKNKILSDPYLSDIEKKQKLATAVFNNQDKIDYITNPNKGKSANVWSMATVYGNAGMIGDIASIAAQSYMMGMGGASHMLSATVPMFLSTQNSFYQQAIEEGRRDPQSYANLHALIMAAAGLINPDLDIVKRTLGMKTATGKIIAGIDESTWNALVSKNRPTIDKIIGGAKAAAAETAKMGLIYGAGTSIASNVADKYFFNKKISASEIADQAIDETKNTIINSLGLITFNGIENGRNTNFVSPDSKAVIWQLGHNEDIGKAFIDEHLKNGDITEAEAKQKKEIISKIASLIDKVPDLNNNNKPLTDKQKVDYLYNLFIKTKLSELKQSLPDSKKEAIKAKEEEIDNANSKIFNTTVKVNDIAPTEDKTETTLPEHQEIGHQILSHVGINPDSEGPKVYDATNIHTIDTDGMDEVQTKVVGDVGKIISSVSNLVQHTTGSPLTITLHDSPKTYREAVLESGGTKQDATTKGFYLDRTGQIHLNMANVTSETLKHEAFHPVLDYLAEKNPGIIDEFHQQLSKLKGGQEVIDNAIQNYDGDITQKKEAITDYIAKVANGDIQLDRSAFEKVKDWIVNTLKTLGLPIEKSIESINDLRNLAKNISQKFNTGEELKTEFHPIENNGEHGSALAEIKKPIPQFSREQNENEDIVSASVNVAPLYSTKVETPEQASQMQSSEFYKEFKRKNEELATRFGLKVSSQKDGIGGFAGVSEATTVVNVTGKFEDIVKYAAVSGALTPEVQESTIAGMYVKEGSSYHNADKLEVGIDNMEIAMKAAKDAGFDENGYTLLNDEISFFDIHEFRTEGFDKKIDIFASKYEEYGGQITRKEKHAVRSEYIDAEKRKDIISRIQGDAIQYKQDRSGLRDELENAQERNENFLKWKDINDSDTAKEYRDLRQKQLDLSENGEALSDKEDARIKELESKLSEPLASIISSNKKQYEKAKIEIDSVAHDVASLVAGGFKSEFGIKRPSRAAVKVVRWYDVQPNNLGDGARANVIVNTNADADFLFNEMKRRFKSTLNRDEGETTNLGYPKRLIEVRTKTGKIAEIQVMTPQGYLAKDGIKHFPEDAKAKAEKSLDEVRSRLGWDIPDGVGHYFYELHRDPNVPNEIKKQAEVISNKYYQAFLNPESNLTDNEFRTEITDFKNKVDAADKSKWDNGNEGHAPEELSKYLEEQTPEFSKGNNLDRKISSAIDAQRQAGQSEEAIKKGLESVREHLGITDDDITRLMTPKEEPKTAEPVKAEPSQKQSSGTLISKAGLKESEYPFSKEFDERGGQEVATDMLSRIKSQATRNHITLEDQLAKKVASMKGENPHPTEYNIISAGTHLLNIDKRIQAAIESGHNTDALVRERMETAEVLRRLGNNAGRNLGLFNLIFKDANRSEIKVEVNRIQKALKVKDLPESMADLNARLNKGEIDKYEYAKVKPYVEKIEEVKNAIAKMETEFQEKARLENRKTEEAALKEAYNKGKEDALNSKKPVLERRGNKELADKLRGLKINKRGESPSTPEEARPQFSNENGSSKEERWASKIDDIAALVEKEMTIKEAIAQLITEGTLEKGDQIGVEQFIAKTIQAESSIDKLKASAEGGEKTITDQMVKDGTIKDIVEGVLHSGLSYDKVIDEATAQIKEVLPDVTRANVSDAYFRKGDFALETKKKLNESIDDKRQQVRLLARKEAIVAAHEDAADVHTASTKEEKNRIISEKEKEYDEKIKKYEIDNKEANKFYGESDADHRRIEGLEDELSDLQKNIVKEKDATKKREYTEREQALRDKISEEKKRISNEEKEANKFYGESDAGNRKLEGMKDELDRLTARKEKNNTPAEEKEISEKQQELQRKIDAERRAWNKEKYLEKIKEEMDYVELNRKVFVKAIKNKSEAESVYKLAKEGLDKAYSEAGLRRETGELRPVQVERMYQNEVDKVNGDTSMSDEEKKAKLEDLKAQRETDLAGTKQGVISQLSDSLEDLRKRLMDRANKALENEDKKSFDEHNKLNMKIQGIISDLNPNGENLVDVANKAYGKLEALLKDESLSSESKAALEKIKRDFENNSKLTYNEMAAKRLKAQWEAEIRAKETKINSGDYSEMPENKFDFRTNEDLMLLNAKRQALTGKLKNLANEAKEKNKDWLDKALGLSSKLLVSGVHTIMKVTEAGSFKPVMDSIVELSAGNMVSGLTQTGRTSLGDVGEGMKALAAFRNKDAALRYVEKTKVNRANALEELGKAIQNGNKDAIAKADEAFKKADLIHAIATIYRSIDANSLVTFWNYVAHASTDYDEMMGKGGKKYMEDYKTKLEKTGYVLDGWIRMHSAMKTSLSARQALLRSFSSTLTEFQRQGRPLNEANISLAMIIANDAYEEGRLTNKTAVSKAVTGLKNSENAVVGKGSNIIFPVSTIAFNIAKRGIDYSSLGAEGWTRLALESKKGMRLNEAEGKEYDGWFKAVKAGISRIPIQERKYINGVISRGMFGAAMTLVTMWGLANGKIKYGGTYDDQRKRKIMGSDHKQLLAGEWEFFGHKMGKLGNAFLNHLPEFMPLALAANHYQIHKAGEGWISGSTISTDLQEVEARLPFQTLLGIFDPNRTMKTVVDRFTRIPLAAELGQELDPLASERDKSNIWNRIKANTGFESFNDSRDQQKAIDNLDKMQSKALAKAMNQEEINTINTRAAAIKESILKQPIKAKK